ncbi:MAG: M20 family metallopeptidase [Bacteroidota bacterium]
MTEDPLVGLLADLVAIPSMNPMGRARAGAEYSEAALAGHVADYLRRHAIDVELQEVAPGRPNVIAHIDAGAAKTLLLEAHLDTVYADGMSFPPFTPAVRDGRLYGRGSCDTKGSLAAFLHAAVTCAAARKSMRYNVVLAAVADEEYKFTGATHAVAKGLRADMGIAGEPTRLRIVRAHKGVTRWKIVTTGVSAHAAYPDRGENAIYAMGGVLARLERYAAALQNSAGHPLLGPPTLSVGVIEGGQAVNVVPDRCVIEIDRRTLPGESTDAVLAAVQKTLEGVAGWRFEPPHLIAPPMETPAESPVVGELSDAIRRITGSVTFEAAPYATDAGVYGSAGIPSVVFGPGDIAQAHTADEWIEIDELQRASKIIMALLSMH